MKTGFLFKAVLCLLFTIPLARLDAQSITGPETGGGTGGTANKFTDCGVGATTTCTVSGLSLSSLDPTLLACKTTAGAIVPFTFVPPGAPPITSVVFNYSATSGVVCTVNSSGVNGATGPVGSAAQATLTGNGSTTTLIINHNFGTLIHGYPSCLDTTTGPPYPSFVPFWSLTPGLNSDTITFATPPNNGQSVTCSETSGGGTGFPGGSAYQYTGLNSLGVAQAVHLNYNVQDNEALAGGTQSGLNGVLADGVCNGTATFTSATANFQASAAGEYILINGCGTTVLNGVYESGLSGVTGAAGTTCRIDFTNGGGTGSFGFVYLPAANTVPAAGAPIYTITAGSAFTSAPTAGTGSNGTATNCATSAGAAVVSTNLTQLGTTIASVTSTSSIVLSTAATTASGVGFVLGPDNATNIQGVLTTAANNGGGEVDFPCGASGSTAIYTLANTTTDAHGGVRFLLAGSGVTLHAESKGCAKLVPVNYPTNNVQTVVIGSTNWDTQAWQYSVNFDQQAWYQTSGATANTNTITLSTPSQASNFTVGGAVYISQVAATTTLAASIGTTGCPTFTSVTGFPTSTFNIWLIQAATTSELDTIVGPFSGSGPYTPSSCTRAVSGSPAAASYASGATIDLATASATNLSSIVPSEPSRVKGIDAVSGILTLEWALARSFTTAIIAPVSNSTTSNVAIENLDIEGQHDVILVQNVFNVRVEDSTEIIDSASGTSTSSWNYWGENQVRGEYLNHVKWVPSGTVPSLTCQLASNNTQDIWFLNSEFYCGIQAIGEYPAHARLNGNKWMLTVPQGQTTGFTAQGIDIVVDGETITCTNLPVNVNCFLDLGTSGFSTQIGVQTRIVNNTISVTNPTSGNQAVFLKGLNTEFVHNHINAGGAIGLEISDSNQTNPYQHLIANDNTFEGCAGTYCVLVLQTANGYDGVNFIGNTLTGSSTNAIDFGTPPGSGATGTATESGGSVTIAIGSGGTLYVNPPICKLTGGGPGTYTSCTTTISGGVVQSATVTGSVGYTSNPTVSFVPVNQGNGMVLGTVFSGNSTFTNLLNWTAANHPGIITDIGTTVGQTGGWVVTSLNGPVIRGQAVINPGALGTYACQATPTTYTISGIQVSETAPSVAILGLPTSNLSAATGFAPLSTGGVQTYGYIAANTLGFVSCYWGTLSTITPAAFAVPYLIFP